MMILTSTWGPLLILGIWAWVAIVGRWQRGMYLLLLYVPFAGVVQVAFYPAAWPVLLKDVLFVGPAYLGYILQSHYRSGPRVIPPVLTLELVALTSLVIVQMLNPSGRGLMAALIGAKVWLFYLPLLLLGIDLVRSRRDLIRLSRLMTACAWIPCLVGILEWIVAHNFGYRATMWAIYGQAASAVTQTFTAFETGLMRIPSTFSFPSQYFNYILAAMVPAWAMTRLDPSRGWARLGMVTVLLLSVAGVMSGVRSAFVFIPIMLIGMYATECRASSLRRALAVVPVALAAMLYLTQSDAGALFNAEFTLGRSYYHDVAVGAIDRAFHTTLVGLGTGTNTGAARYASGENWQSVASFGTLENYYAKAEMELGVPGLGLIVAIYGSLALYAYWTSHSLRERGLRAYAVAIFTFIVTFIIYDFKGCVIDLDPVNALFWLFCGVLFRLPALQMEADAGGKVRR